MRATQIGYPSGFRCTWAVCFALIMRQGAMQTALAIGAGLLLSLAAGRVLAKILYDVSPSDPLALIIATLMLAGAALLACFFPSHRASRLNPVQQRRANKRAS